MAVSIIINGLTLVHKDSGGVAKATMPDTCLTPTPSGPVPINYPNIAYSKDLAKGTTTVFADGGHMCANKGSEFSKSIGDEAGSVGGILSGTRLAEATWITYSPDVFLEGKNACRLADKMLMNHGNTICLAGVLNPELQAKEYAPELQTLCNLMCDINELPGPKQKLIEKELKKLDRAMGFKSTIKAEVPYNMKTLEPYMSKNEPARATNNWFISGHRRPDAVITDGSPPTQNNIRAVVEMKFKGDTLNEDTKIDYETIAGAEDKLIVMEEGKNCHCDDEDGKKEPVKLPAPQPFYEPKKNWWKKAGLVGTAGVMAVGAFALAICPFEGPLGETALGSASYATWAMAFAL